MRGCFRKAVRSEFPPAARMSKRCTRQSMPRQPERSRPFLSRPRDRESLRQTRHQPAERGKLNRRQPQLRQPTKFADRATKVEEKIRAVNQNLLLFAQWDLLVLLNRRYR